MTSKSPKRILVAYSMMSTFTPTTLEYLLALKSFTDYDVQYIHVTHDAHMGVDFNDYDVLFNNYCSRLCFDGYVSAHYERAVANFRGLKMIAVQDDYDRTANLHRALRRMGFHVLLTCIQREFWPLVYPASELPGLTIIQGITGYMPERIAEARPVIIPLSERKTWVAYRGRDIGAKYGRLGFEKYEIGRRMIEECRARGVPHDIAMDDASRIYGDAWFKFLGSSRTVLGTESGSNIFDFDGSLEKRIEEFTQREKRAPTYHEFKPVLDPIEARFNIGQISPRVFETAVMRTPMINFRGNYSDAMQPDVHYIALEKDFSNVGSVFAKLDDLELLEGFAARAYDKLVKSGDYGHRSLARLVSDTIETEFPKRIDPNWVRFRRETGEPWRKPPRVDHPETEEEARRIALLETPTEMPLNSEAFYTRHAQLASLTQTAIRRHALRFATGRIVSALVAGPPDPDGAAAKPRDLNKSVNHLVIFLHNLRLWRIARAVWRLLPLSMRRFLLHRLGLLPSS